MNIRGINLSLLVALLGFAAGSGSVRADAVNIDQNPLFLVPPVKPALIMAVDDSGSMDSEILVDANDGAMWWNSNNESFTGLGTNADGTGNVTDPGRINFNASGANNGTWQKYTYVFPNGNSGQDGRLLGLNDHHGVPPLPQFAYARSPEFNAIYFNPEIEYPPWPSEGSQTFEDADELNAQADPERGSQIWNLTENKEENDEHWTFTFYEGMTIPSGTRIREAEDDHCDDDIDDDEFEDWKSVGSDIDITEEDCDVAISYYPATFWLSAGNPPPAEFGFKPGKKIAGGLAPDGSAMEGYEIKLDNFTSTAKYNDAIQQFANWFQYYRKRVHLTRASMGRSFVDTEFLRLGFTTINSRNNVTMRDMEIGSQREAYFDWQYDLEGSGGTPNKQAVKHIGDQFANRTGSNAPILEACQRNFGMLVTDGFSNTWNSAGVGNTDGSSTPAGEPAEFGARLSDGRSNTMADIAYSFYNTAMRTDIGTGTLPVDSRCFIDGDSDNGLDPNRPLRLDCNDDLHMNLFAVTLGAKGLIFGRDEDATNDPLNELTSADWPTSFPTRHPNAVDDIWHAALNSRGNMFTATRPDELVEVLTAVLREIAARIQPVGISASAARVDEDSLFFEANLDSSRWSGNIKAFATEDESEEWSAEDELPSHGARTIKTSISGSAVDFTTSDAVRTAVFGSSAPSGSDERKRQNDIINYLRGKRGDEEQNGGTLRDRKSRPGDPTDSDPTLGDIANSRPTFSGPRNEGWGRLDAGYLEFLDDLKQDRDPIVLVGANDGMLHAFDATDTATGGKELFAYVPSMVHDRLPALADPDYVHKYYVDGQLRVADAKIGKPGNKNGWNTIAVGGLGGGGRGVYALNITDPNNFSTDDVLWELTADDDSDIGHVYDEPIVTRLSNDDWVAIFANGFNSDDDQAHLFVVNLDDGSIKQKLALGDAGDNGLASTAALIDPQTRLSTRRVYAGDLEGNMWAIEFNDSGSASNRFAGPLINVGRPIVSPPVLAPNPGGGLMVFFGTGKLIETSDRLQTDPPLEQFFAVRDQGSALTISDLGEASASGSGSNVTVTSPGDISDGWRLELAEGGTENGERVLSRPQVVFGQLIFTTFEPQDDICEALGIPRIYVLDALSGRGILNQQCQNCGVIELNPGGPIDPAIILRPPTASDDSDLIGGGGDGDSPPELPGIDDVGALSGWCSDILMLVPGEGFVSIGTLCDGRQIWRQAR